MLRFNGVTYAQALEFLGGLGRFGMRPGLETTLRLAGLAGHPQRPLRFVHVAGTNGKGSTCAMLESICRAAGHRVGLYTSPHLVRMGERIQVDRKPIPDDDLARLVGQLADAVAGENPRHPELPRLEPTFFEFITVVALRFFAEQRCDVVIWETGLGGRLDATNIITPLASVITNIGWDHQQWLGNSLASIASEKAGIIKPGIPVITGADNAEALGVIRTRAASLGAPLTVVTAAAGGAGDGMRVPLRGRHQQLNAAVAAATARALAGALSISESHIRAGMERVWWPGRFEVISTGQSTLILDGAHNPPGIHALVETFQSEFPGRKATVVTGMLGDKDCEGMCRALATVAREVFLVPVGGERGADLARLQAAMASVAPEIPVIPLGSVDEGRLAVAGRELVLVSGSLYLLGEWMEALSGRPGWGDERRLNHWSGSGTLTPGPRTHDAESRT